MNLFSFALASTALTIEIVVSIVLRTFKTLNVMVSLGIVLYEMKI